MKVLTDLEAMNWLKKRGVATDAGGCLSFEHTTKSTRFVLSPPRTREAVTSLAVNLVEVLGCDHNASTGWLLWLKDFDIWSNEIEEIGWTLVEALMQRQSELNLNSSAFVFEPHEKSNLKATLLVPILFMWDAYLIRDDGEVLVRIDHDDLSSIATTSDAVLQEMKESQLSPWLK
jgi:hypothetical protein